MFGSEQNQGPKLCKGGSYAKVDFRRLREIDFEFAFYRRVGQQEGWRNLWKTRLFQISPS